MKKLLVFAALGLAVSLSGAPAFADQQTTGDEVDNALNWAAAGGRGGIHGAHAESVHHGGFSGAYDMVDPPSGSGGNGFFVYGSDHAPYASEGGATLDFQLQR